MESSKIKESYYRYLRYFLAKDDTTATLYDKYMSLSYAVRSGMVDKWIETQRQYREKNLRRVFFLSMEYIFGRSLRQNIVNLDIEEYVTSIAGELGFSLDEIYGQEESFDLGNGGKGRLAACLQDAMATASVPAMAYGLRYDFGLFHQEIENGAQVEQPYDWLHKGHPWEIIRPEYCAIVNYYGRTEAASRAENPLAVNWTGADHVVAVPYDFPVPGYKNSTVNTLRLWCARASEEFLPDYANHGDYLRACEDKSQSGTITSVLFPDEDVLRATELRLKQQYFLISASLQDILRRFKRNNSNIMDLHKKAVIQLSGSNCALAVPELMRQLVDVENMPWAKAWEVTSQVFAYTSQAVSREGLESWPVYLLSQVLPRHMQIIYEINQNHLDNVRESFGNNNDLIREISVIQEGEVKRVKLGHLATIASYKVNGVSTEQTELLKKSLLPEFAMVFPERFCAKTNGVSHRRWLLTTNYPLSSLICKTIGEEWVRNPVDLVKLEHFADNPEFIRSFLDIRMQAKKTLAEFIGKSLQVDIDTAAMFDVHCKKIHQYKRQALNVLHLLSRYLRIKNGEILPAQRVHIFAGKAAPADQLAKQIIKLIHVACSIVNNDPVVSKQMKAVFLPDYGVNLAEKIIPATDLSEQIATPGQEASGTGNAKFALNGALLMASKSGSNMEIINRIGEENAFVFGRSASELPHVNDYQPYDQISANAHLSEIFSLLDQIIARQESNSLSIRPLLSTLMDSDRYFVLLDFDDYVKKQNDADLLFNDPVQWAQKSIMNIAHSGYFTIDKTVSEYARDIWKVPE